jgi:hypothetical protein
MSIVSDTERLVPTKAYSVEGADAAIPSLEMGFSQVDGNAVNQAVRQPGRKRLLILFVPHRLFQRAPASLPACHSAL